METNKHYNESNKAGEQQAEAEAPAQKIAVNDNPAANANITQAPFDKTTTSNNAAENAGTEITDGEDG